MDNYLFEAWYILENSSPGLKLEVALTFLLTSENGLAENNQITKMPD